LLVLVTPTRTSPMGLAFSQPAPDLRTWEKQERRRKPQGIPNPPPLRSIRPNKSWPSACYSQAKCIIPPSVSPALWPRHSLGQRPVSMAPRPSLVGCRSSAHSGASSKYVYPHGHSPLLTLVPPTPGRPRQFVSGVVQRGSPWSRVPACPSGPTIPNAGSSR